MLGDMDTPTPSPYHPGGVALSRAADGDAPPPAAPSAAASGSGLPRTAARLCWELLGSPAHEPPEPARGKPRYGTSPTCWLCGGDSGARPWPRALVPVTFTNPTLSPCPTADAVCQPCAYFSFGDGWRTYVAEHPDRGLKATGAMGWRSYSHAFSAAFPGGHRTPKRREWRALLLDPPAPPFVYVIAESGQKHILWRARVARSRDRYPVQVEEDRLIVDRGALGACIAQVERLLALGFTRDEIACGRYAPHRTLAAGSATWWPEEERMAWWRGHRPHDVRLALVAAHKPGAPEDTDTSE